MSLTPSLQNRITERFNLLAERHEPAFIPYITAGDPSLDGTEKLVYELERAGADVIEFGVPFSDPLADGAVNQEAALRALKQGVTLRKILVLVKKLRATTQIPIVLFTYYNPLLAIGLEEFAETAAEAGVDGVLCVDLPPEEAGRYRELLNKQNVATIFLIAPTSPAKRIALIARQSSGFVYYVSRTGVTGERADIESSVNEMVGEIKKHTSLPVAVGFGISTPEQAAEVGCFADGVIVGSAIVRMIGQLGDAPDMPQKVGAFVKSLADATKKR